MTTSSLAGRPPVPIETGRASSNGAYSFNRFARDLAINAAVALAYAVTAVIGFRFAFVAEQVTTVWAPTGIALSALLVGGPRLWPAIWIGALAANAGSSAPLWTAMVIATGNTLEAVVAVWALRRLRRFDIAFRRVADVFAFVIVAATACTAISATVGVVTLCTAGVQSWDRFSVLWFDWWLGDALGAVIVAPAILTAWRHQWTRRDCLLGAGWIGAAILVTHVVFGHVLGVSPRPLEYVVFPVVIIAAVTGGPIMTSLVVLSASTVTIWHTVHGSGPFATPEVHYSLILLQVFMGVLAVTSLLLGAAIADRATTERRERDAAANLRNREDVLSLAMRGGSMGAWSRNLVTNEVWWSRELEEIVGLEPGEFNRTEAGFFAFIHEDDRGAVRKAVDDGVQNDSDYVVEFRFRHANGEWRWMEGRGRAVYGEDRTPRTLYGIGIDVTDRKHAELALRNAKIAAESANELKDQFLATLSHELRTPLNAILGYARMLRTNAIAPEKRPRALDIIERNAVAQNQLVEDLLDMSRITTGKVRLAPEPMPAATVLREAVEGIKPAADAKGIALELAVDPFAGSVRADPTRLQQVFWNLLTNAVKFTNAGGRIAVALLRKDADVEITIADTGAGISSEFLPYVFEPFRQADSRSDRAYGGLGLGLAITRQLVELHGGSIGASSAGIGLGSAFTIRLPCVNDEDVIDVGKTSAAPGIGNAPHPAPSASLTGVTVLVVDDEEDTLTMFRDILEDAGARVRAVSSSAEALQAADEWQPNLLVTDLGLPGMDGYELLRVFRKKHSKEMCPAVAVSAYARLDDRARAFAAGFQAYIAKPVDPANLLATLRQVTLSIE